MCRITALTVLLMTNPCLSAQQANCETHLTHIQVGFLKVTNPQLEIVRHHANAILNEMAKELNVVQRQAFLRTIARTTGVGLASAGSFKNGRLRLNVFNEQHPQGWISLVHEAQHLFDTYPGTGALGRLIVVMQPNAVNYQEARAFGREYDLLKRLINDPKFNAEEALNLVPRSKGDLPYDMDEPMGDGLDGPSEEFLDHPEKFLAKPGARARLEKMFLEMADGKFLSQLKIARSMTKEEYVKFRLDAYARAAAQAKKIAYAVQAATALMGVTYFTPLICFWLGLL